MVNDHRRGNSESRPRRRGGGCAGGGGCGCALPSFVVVVGIILAIFSTNLGIGVSVRVPFTESNLSVAGSVGSKEMAIDTLPNYLEQKVADNTNFLNQSITLTEISP